MGTRRWRVSRRESPERGFLEVLGALLDSSKYGVLVMTLFVTKIQWAFVYGKLLLQVLQGRMRMGIITYRHFHSANPHSMGCAGPPRHAPRAAQPHLAQVESQESSFNGGVYILGGMGNSASTFRAASSASSSLFLVSSSFGVVLLSAFAKFPAPPLPVTPDRPAAGLATAVPALSATCSREASCTSAGS